MWPELGGLSETINNDAYDCFADICVDGLLGEDYYESWPLLSLHGRVCGLVTYLYFYSHYHAVCSDVCQYLDEHSIAPNPTFEAVESIRHLLDSQIQPGFLELYTKSIAKHPHPKLYYERGLIHFHQGDPADAARDIRHFMEGAEESGLEDALSSELYHNQGQMYLESGQYDRAIEHLSLAITMDPDRREVYFDRASCYLEMGDLDLALADYYASGFQNHLPELFEEPDRVAFAKEFMGGACTGSVDALKEFVPSTIGMLNGIGRCLWAAMPVPGANQRAAEIGDAVVNMVDYLKDTSTGEMLGDLVPEVRALVQEDWSSLSDEEKGRRCGYIVGKYGVEVLCGVGVYKVVKYVRAARRANYLATLESATTQANKEALVARAAEQARRRKTMLKSGKLKIQWDKQGKHIRGHRNFSGGKSVLTHPNPEILVKEYAGTGIPRGNKLPGTAGYRETVDFGVQIGEFWVEGASEGIATTRGTVHYSAKGCHIVPSMPLEMP